MLNIAIGLPHQFIELSHSARKTDSQTNDNEWIKISGAADSGPTGQGNGVDFGGMENYYQQRLVEGQTSLQLSSGARGLGSLYAVLNAVQRGKQPSEVIGPRLEKNP